MSAAQTLTGSIAASHVIKWLRAWYRNEGMPDAIDLEVVRQLLPGTPYGTGVREIRPPVQFNDDAFEGMLARDPDILQARTKTLGDLLNHRQAFAATGMDATLREA